MSMLIGRYTVQDKYARAEAKSFEKFNDTYDVNYIKDKFRQTSAEPWLLERLGKAITKRRQYLKYVKEYRPRMEPVSSVMPGYSGSGTLESQVLEPHPDVSSQVIATTNPDHSRPSLRDASAPTLALVKLDPTDEQLEDDRSISTTTTSLIDEGTNPLAMPSLYSITRPGTAFSCPYCSSIQSFESQQSWRQACLYCLSEGC